MENSELLERMRSLRDEFLFAYGTNNETALHFAYELVMVFDDWDVKENDHE